MPAAADPCILPRVHDEAVAKRRRENLTSRRTEVRAVAPSIRNFAQAIDHQRGSLERLPLIFASRPGAAALLAALDEAEAAAVAVFCEHPAEELPPLGRTLASLSVPALRADLILEEFQIYESRAAGFDAVLLHASLLPDPLLARLCDAARSTHMAAAVVVATAADLARALAARAPIVAPAASAAGRVAAALLAGVPRRTLILAVPALIAAGQAAAIDPAGLPGLADAILDGPLGAAADPAAELRRHLDSEGPSS